MGDMQSTRISVLEVFKITFQVSTHIMTSISHVLFSSRSCNVLPVNVPSDGLDKLINDHIPGSHGTKFATPILHRLAYSTGLKYIYNPRKVPIEFDFPQ